MELAIILTSKYRLLSLAAIVDVFETANRFLQEAGQPAQYHITFVGLTASADLPQTINHLPYRPIADTHEYDLVFVPAFGAVDIVSTIAENGAFVPWLHRQYSHGAALASNCTGAFLLAASGLLNGRQATTHVDAADMLASSFPKVKLMHDAVVTHDANIYTSGGATSGFHLMLALIQKRCGREMAVRIAKVFSIDMDRENQAHFGHFAPTEAHDDELVLKLQHKIKTDFSAMKNLEEAIADIPASRRNLVRRFKHATGMTPIRYLQRTKIEAAKKMLENTEKGLLEVMLATGYNDMKNFRQLFKDQTGMTPKAYRDKFAMRFERI